ncbi:hypothetical protein Pmi06nite_32820 [Planotetraspora mira]|uniref:Uncharacterized protein n=1 Tax=Planotetraspora mira TaxID=58121 RepID=A0A8J3X6R6_9ACTN|nr:hypothetical protein Pmi06nite_32820 [Planotetraspora mira]
MSLIVPASTWIGEVIQSEAGGSPEPFSLVDLVTNVWMGANAWVYAASASIFAGVVLPAVWSTKPFRRKAAAEMVDRLLRFFRRRR